MSIVYQITEILATFIEGAIALFVSGALCGKKDEKKKYYLFYSLATVVYTVIITLMNQWQVFSFVTIAIAMVYTFIVVSFLSNGAFINKLTSVIITIFFIHATEYLISYSLIMIIGKSLNISNGIPLILETGSTRMVFLTLDKVLQILIFLCFRKTYSKLQLLNKGSLYLILVITSLSYIVMSILTQMIITDSLITLQIAVTLSLFFIILSIIITIVSVSLNAKFQNEKRETQVIMLANELMEKNYTEIKHTQDIIRKQVHDFKNHILTIDGMLSEDSNAKKYTQELLSASYQQAQNCHSGNEIIDSIINCKMNEAVNNGIEFIHKISLNTKLTISFVDICAILANQIDNALEACMKIPKDAGRNIKVEIWQKESFVFFKVINTALKNPFIDSKELITTKESKDSMHGFGIKNIKETAAKYDGTLKNDYIDGCFISLVMISNHE